jgi:LPS-assembly protein
MRKVPAIALLLFLAVALPCVSRAQVLPGYNIKSQDQVISGAPPGSAGYNFATGSMAGTNLLVQYKGATIIADSISVNEETGEATADGHVRIQDAGQMWIGDHITYNFKTHKLESGTFRTGKSPFYVQGRQIETTATNTYTARKVYLTTDNVNHPAYYIQANRMIVVPGQYIEAWNAVLYVEGVPLFYYPYFHHGLGANANAFTFMPGDDSMYGPYLLSTYIWHLDKNVDGRWHFDYRSTRGFGGGPDLNLHLDQWKWGDPQLKYYYIYDHSPGSSISSNIFQNISTPPKSRQRFYFGWQATPYTNGDMAVNTKALVNYQSDQLMLHDFFQNDYGQNPQPNTFVEANPYWRNWSLDAETTPRINGFFDQVERLPDVQLTGFRQEVFDTPLYYESQSSVGYYERYFAGTNTLFGNTNFTAPQFIASRADTFHQLLLPETLFGWLNITPRVGGRVTWYGPEQGPGGTNGTATRFVLNAGTDISLKASQLWPDATNSVLNVDGLRHIIVPSVSYVFVPHVNVAAPQAPQFDTQLPNLLILPVEFPDYNDIDSIQSENVLRFGLRNTLQTKRDGRLDNLFDWNLMLDWNLTPNGQTNAVFLQPQKTFDDFYSDFVFKPRTWIALESQLRYDINDNHLNMAFHQITFTPSDRWSWSLGQWYLHPGFIDVGDNIITSTFFYRLNENWGVRSSQYFNIRVGRIQEQDYSLYRDLRSWTAAVTFRLINNGGGQPLDYGFAFSISLKASPRFGVGSDAIHPYEMLGE